MKRTKAILAAVFIGIASICQAQRNSPSTRTAKILLGAVSGVPTVKSIEFEKTVTPIVMGESDKYYVKYEDCVSGYVFTAKSTNLGISATG